MSKIFFDVFPTLKVNDEIRMLFESVQVEKVSTNRQRDFINVFLFSDHLIQKRHIYSMEGMIKDQLFASCATQRGGEQYAEDGRVYGEK